MKPENIVRFNELIKKLQGKTKKADFAYMSLCPAHGDSRLSLYTKLNDDGKICLFCHSGCTEAEVCIALGIEPASLYPIAQIIARYDFIDFEGNLLFQEVKYDATALARFKVRRPSGKPSPNEWIWNEKGVTRILQNLREVLMAGKDDIIFMCEGSKDAINLKHKNLIATACLFNEWSKTDTSPLDGKYVVILIDNDDAGHLKALKGAHDRHRKSKSIKLLLLPDLKPGGDVSDWLESGRSIEDLMNLARNQKIWFPQQSVRDQVEVGKETGQTFEHRWPRPIFESFVDIYHPKEEGPLNFWDEMWLKGNMITLLYKEISINTLKKPMSKWLELCSNAKSKNGEDPFKPTDDDFKAILKIAEIDLDLNALKNPIMPIFNPFYMQEKLKNYRREDIAILKSANFYVPERCVFPRNMEACIAMNCLPFDYDELALCPEINKAFNTQWENDKESEDMLLQFLSYYITTNFLYKAILYMIGESNSGKSMFLELIRHFIGYDNCITRTLPKIGNRFELWGARYKKLIIADDAKLTERDLQNNGDILTNCLNIPSGFPIRIEAKNGAIDSRKIAAQLLLAGNNPIKIQEFSNSLANRFKFLVFPHIYEMGVDMEPEVLQTWLPELAGLFNRVLDAGLVLAKSKHFIEPKSSAACREQFIGGNNPVYIFINEEFESNAIDDPNKWVVRVSDMREYYRDYTEREKIRMFSSFDFNNAMKTFKGITQAEPKETVHDKVSGTKVRKTIRVWKGLRKKGTSGKLFDKAVQPEF